MAMAPEHVGIGIRRHFTDAGTHPYDQVELGAARRTDHQLPRRGRGLRAARGRVPRPWSLNATNIVAQKYFRGTLGTPERETSLAPGGRPGGRHDHRVGHPRRLLRRRRRGRGLPGRAQVPRGHPAGSVQLAGVVQHRRRRRPPAGVGLFHPLGRRHDGLDPQLVRRGGHHLQGGFGCRHQPVADPFLRRAVEGRGNRVGAGQLHAGRRRRRQARSSRAARPDGPPRWSSSTSTTRTSKSSSGARPARSTRPGCCATRASTWISTVPTATPSSTRTRTTRCGSPTSSCRPSSTTTTGTCVPAPMARSCAPSVPATCSARSPRPPGSAPIPGCSSTPRSTTGTPRPRPGASTGPTRAASTCIWTTPPATWPA